MKFKIMGKELDIKLKVILPVLAVLVAALVTTGLLIAGNEGEVLVKGTSTGMISGNNIKNSGTVSGNNTDIVQENSNKKTEQIQIYITGCVKYPGIVNIGKGQLIDDAIKAAGGATEEADIENINLVYKLNENVMLHIRSKKDVQSDKTTAKNSDTGTSPAGIGAVISTDSSGAVINSTQDTNSSQKKVNINEAGMEELCTLSGVGEATAADIIAYREKSGPFKQITDIMKVPGIKQNKYNKIKDSISVE
ncbi:MAG: helix-hairpin-helix domain-containing protein [Bacillota bacterium]|nr:helix-hairpin-helix domain-containing protein [Bacillota bacterium]